MFKIKELEEKLEALKNTQIKATIILEQFNDMINKQQKVIERMVGVMEDLTGLKRRRSDEVPKYIG